MDAILKIDSVSKRFGGLMALSDVSFQVTRGQILGLIGPNGAGKTTMFNCIAGIYKPTEGSILFEREGRHVEVGGSRPEQMTQMGVARTFQNIRLFASLSVLDNVRIGRHCRAAQGFWGAVLRTRAQKAEEKRLVDQSMSYLDFVGLGPKALDLSSALSYGDQRRLEIARALASEPRLLLLDEPAAGMNPQETASLVDLIHAILAKGVDVVLIEHDMKLVMSICQHLVVLDHGVKIAEGGPREIRENPEVIEAYLGRGAAHA
ncbi:Glutamine transport ATP-binding protein GlnQ [Fundidesulfovibrio magnetotacticus]|uniref:Glutamine transport ATP-binding protein GlnQ n=1 Tax=Fundidesulfovibrio magnetotacticus TaxID=2730080 RepID=A0A6V8LWU2_9BACT|nr:ABC transporter ATP-binding protein [Fundidesulfovibrio magnetotacticus]GFK94266.1 Glutamine transport ATP-binding protein GlnQ [Fundidesulfovibrio magnetotacticus]